MLRDSRKFEVLSAAVEIYTETGEPVGSKAICDRLDFPVSSATVRKELSDLCELGFMEQPHTSAGRVPTVRGYRLYLDSLMHPRDLTDEDKRRIDRYLPSSGEADKMLEQAGKGLAELTGCAVISTSVTSEDAYVRRVELVPMGTHTAMLVVLISTGTLKTGLCYDIPMVTQQLCMEFSSFAAEHICGIPLSDFSPVTIQFLCVSLGSNMFQLAPVLSRLYELVQQAGKAAVTLSGAENLLKFKELSPQRAGEILRLFSQRDVLLNLMNTRKNTTQVLIGDESRYSELRDSGMVITRYRLSNNARGHIGIVGPARLNYQKLIPSVDYYAAQLGSLLERIIEK